MVTWDDFNKIWASTSPLTPYEFSDPNYSQGWNFIGSTPPARQMWDSIQKKNDEKFKYLRDNFGTPHIVTQASDMTDTDMVYVYMGSEAGWNSGHWYYYDEGTSSWADGGVYNSVAFVTDTTLSIAGQPADAKAVGDALALKADIAGCTFTGNVSVNADFSVTGDSSFDDVSVNADFSVTGDSSFDDVSISGTAIGVTPTAGDNTTKLATTEYVQTEIKPIETDVTINDKRITNIEKLLQGNLYDYQTDSTSAYTKSVPSGALPYAGLEKVGGKTIVWNQLYRVVDGSSTSYGVSVVRSSSASTYTVSGTANTTTTIWLPMYKPDGTMYDDHDRLINGHKYATLLKGNNLPLFRHSYDGVNRSNKSYILTGNGSYGFPFGMDVTAEVTYNFTLKIMLIDLTLMFGAGNEPTIEQFEAMFPSDWYDDTYGTLLSANITRVNSYDTNNYLLSTFNIPTAVTNLSGYGISTRNAYNYVDFERKKFMKIVTSRAYISGDENNSDVITDGTTTYIENEFYSPVDISEYLTDDNLIQVEAGGTLEFTNGSGIYRNLPVPSEETYMIDLQASL